MKQAEFLRRRIAADAVGAGFFAASLALGLTLVRRFRAVTLSGILGALSLSATFHGLYNLLVSHSGVPATIGYALPLLTAAALYPAYRRLK